MKTSGKPTGDQSHSPGSLDDYIRIYNPDLLGIYAHTTMDYGHKDLLTLF